MFSFNEERHEHRGGFDGGEGKTRAGMVFITNMRQTDFATTMND